MSSRGSKDWKARIKAIPAGNSNDSTKHDLIWARFPSLGEDEIGAELGDFVPGGIGRPVGRF